jgi:hypothetical protein
LWARILIDLPCLTTPDRLYETIGLGIEKDEVVLVTDDFRISCKILFEGFIDTVIDHDFLAFTPFPFFDPK